MAENEQETELYSPFTTPASCFIEWGIGIDLYFTSVRYMAIILFIAGLINVSNIIFYRSSKYSPNGQSSIRLLLQGSAICTTQTWVVCSDCNPDDPLQSYGVAENGAVLAQKNDCRGGEMTQGMVNYATFFFLVLVLGTVSYYLNAREIRFDEDKYVVSWFIYSINLMGGVPHFLSFLLFFDQSHIDRLQRLRDESTPRCLRSRRMERLF